METQRTSRALPILPLLFLLAFAANPGWCDASDDYQAGLRSFKAQNYELARQSFELALAAGMDKPTLHYNIGVVNFKLADYTAARQSFERIAVDPEWGPLAQYNLGLIAERNGDLEAARGHFAIAADRAASPTLRALAQSRLTPTDHADSAALDKRWIGFISSAVGFDDNVTLAANDTVNTVSNQEDLFLELIAAGSRFLTRAGDGGWRADLAGYYRKHQDLDDFNYGSAMASVINQHTIGAWQIQAGGGIEFQSVANDAFAAIFHTRIRASRPLGDGLALEARHESAYVNGAGRYDYVTGWRHRTSAELVRRRTDSQLRIGYQLELNDRDDFVVDDQFFSYSPTRHRLYVAAETSITSALTGQAQLGFRTSRYDDANVEINPDGSRTVAKRDEDRLSFALRFEYRLSRDWQVFSEYNYADNDSNFERQDYANHVVMIGLQGSF